MPELRQPGWLQLTYNEDGLQHPVSTGREAGKTKRKYPLNEPPGLCAGMSYLVDLPLPGILNHKNPNSLTTIPGKKQYTLGFLQGEKSEFQG
jgi:hypothetical protein